MAPKRTINRRKVNGKPKASAVRKNQVLRIPSEENGADFKGHVHMLVDPCGSPITRSIYSGQSGVVTRHTVSGTISPGANLAHVLWLSPGGFRDSNSSFATDATTYTPGYGAALVPGYSFLTGVTSKARCVSACLRVYWSGPELNRAGNIAYGCVTGGSYAAVPGTTAAQMYNLLPKKSRVPDGAFEVRWNPADEDEDYTNPLLGVDPNDINERNSLMFVFTGLANASFSYTYTTNIEWIPKPTSGQPAPPTIRQSTPAAVPKINNVLNKMKRGAENFNTMATDVATTASSMYAAGATGYNLMTGLRAMGSMALTL